MYFILQIKINLVCLDLLAGNVYVKNPQVDSLQNGHE